MGNPRSINLGVIKTSEQGCEIETSIGYDEGGLNYFHGSENPRGYNLYATVWRWENGRRTTILGMGGLKRRVEAATRFNAKKLKALASLAQDPASPVGEGLKSLVDNVLRKEGLSREGPLSEIVAAVEAAQ